MADNDTMFVSGKKSRRRKEASKGEQVVKHNPENEGVSKGARRRRRKRAELKEEVVDSIGEVKSEEAEQAMAREAGQMQDAAGDAATPAEADAAEVSAMNNEPPANLTAEQEAALAKLSIFKKVKFPPNLTPAVEEAMLSSINADSVTAASESLQASIKLLNYHNKEVKTWRNQFELEDITVKRKDGSTYTKKRRKLPTTTKTTKNNKTITVVDYPEAIQRHKKWAAKYSKDVNMYSNMLAMAKKICAEHDGPGTFFTDYVDWVKQGQALSNRMVRDRPAKIVKTPDGPKVEVTHMADKDDNAQQGDWTDDWGGQAVESRYKLNVTYAKLLHVGRLANPSTGHRAAPGSAPATRRPAEAAPSWMAKLM